MTTIARTILQNSRTTKDGAQRLWVPAQREVPGTSGAPIDPVTNTSAPHSRVCGGVDGGGGPYGFVGGAPATESSPVAIIRGGDDPRPHRQRRRRRVARRRVAFTMTELLIVIALIVLLLALAIPAFSFITGSKSVDGAVNQISAFLGRARSEAIGLQEVRGVMFFIDPATERVTLAMVHQTTAPKGAAPDFIHDINPSDGTDDIDVYLDLVPDADFLPLPPGISAQFVDDAFINNAGVRQDDGYVGFNNTGKTGSANTTLTNAPTPSVRFGGVILFDGNGRLISRTFGFRTRQPDSGAATFTQPADGNATLMGKLLYRGTDTERNGNIHLVPDFLPWQTTSASPATNNTPLKSQFGFVLFERDLFTSAGGNDTDPELLTNNTTYTANSNAEVKEEAWLDSNASPVLINRYNGTVIRGE
jgi:type II secretory pathway pseudopilin PulG